MFSAVMISLLECSTTNLNPPVPQDRESCQREKHTMSYSQSLALERMDQGEHKT